LSLSVTIAVIDDALEAALLRAQFESLGCRVDWRPLGKPSELFAAFDRPADLGILSGHGDAGGLVFPEMAPGVESLDLPDNRMAPGMLAGFADALPPVLISTACDTGTTGFARAFHAAGARLYIAPAGYPDARAVPVILALAGFLVIHRRFAWPDAIAAANALVDPDDHFRLFPA
jgi:hypothetical protein